MMPVHLVVLNHNGRSLLAECLPSVLAAAAHSRHDCRVLVIDNGAHDVDWLRSTFPCVTALPCANEGLCSYNRVLAQLPGRVAVLLNNDIKLDANGVDPLVEPLLVMDSGGTGCFMTAPLCWLFDGQTYEGLKTAVDWRWGLVQATSLFPGHERGIHRPGPTASAGAAMAVDRELFLSLGGFDSLYLPGRLEDLDFCFRGYQAGYEARYVPESVAYHRGQATFGAVHGTEGSLRLAIRNTLLFQWKNLRRPRHVLRHLSCIPLRIAADICRSPWGGPGGRFAFTRALFGALPRLPACLASKLAPERSWRSEAEYFDAFCFARMASAPDAEPDIDAIEQRHKARELARASDYPISRWWLRPLADRVAKRLSVTRVRPWHVTLLGLLLAIGAGAAIASGPAASFLAGLCVMLAWFCDRIDGQLARRQGTASPQGAWLDANVDEFVDLGLHLVMAWTAATQSESSLPWCWLIAFLVGKYLLMYGLNVEESNRPSAIAGEQVPARAWSRLRRAWHLPGNADVRTHLVAAAVLSGWLNVELAWVACYYNVRWMARYALALRRLSGPCPQGTLP